MHLHSIFYYGCTRRKALMLLSIALLLVGSRICMSAANEADVGGPAVAESVADFEAAASELNGNSLTSESHKIIATGWPSTSSMWPTIDTDQDNSSSDSNPDKASQWFRMIEPFIYADKPRTGDYSLLLKINSTVLDALKAHLRPMSVALSFEYYFSHEPESTALPLIKIEVNRKELKYLDPKGQNIRARRWMKFNEHIQIADLQQLEKPDWLKISLVNRDVPSIVAIRRLKAEFSRQPEQIPDSSNRPVADQPFQRIPEQQAEPVVPPPREQPQRFSPPPQQAPPSTLRPVAPPAPPVVEPPRYQPPAQDDQLAPPNEQPYNPAPLPRPQPQPTVDVGDGAGGNELAPGEQPEVINYSQQPATEDLQPAASTNKKASTKPMKHPPASTTAKMDDPMTTSASELLSSTITPMTPTKKKGWGWPGKRRRRRDISSGGAEPLLASATVITLACLRSDDCEWLSDTKDEGIQWSLARMPSSTQTVQAGYYYVSNRNNYGDSSKLLRVSLNQTERATIADQNSDHCLDLAIYVTERTSLRLYRLTKREPPADGGSPESADDWLKGSLLLSWAPTMAINDSASLARVSLPGSRLAAMESGQNGWTMETICFGDFFASPKACGAGKCAFGFVMDTNPLADHQQSNPSGASANDRIPTSGGGGGGETTSDGSASNEGNPMAAEQVVGVSILREFSQNVPLKSNGQRPRWLQTWQREEVEPGDDWKFYPKLDYLSSGDNVSLANLFNDAHYFIQSDWLHADEHLDFTGSLLLEDKSQRNLSRFQDTEQLQPPDGGNVFTLKVRSKLVDSNFNSIYVNESSLDWNIWQVVNGTSSMALNMSITEHLKAAGKGEQRRANEEDNLFKIVLEFVLDLHWISGGTNNIDVGQYLSSDGGAQFKFSLLNVSVSDRCHPNQCEHGSCLQNGTGLDDWNCKCDDKYRGRRCEFGHWCQVPHITAWQPAQQRAINSAQITLKVHGSNGNGNGNGDGGRQPKAVNGGESVQRVSGEQYCKSKLGAGYKCTDIDLPLNDMLYFSEDKTFYCSCRNEFYLSDDSKCRQTHACHSILCPSMGMICDDTKPFNQTQPCHCNEKQDWFPNPALSTTSGSLQEPDRQQQQQQPACVRRQCHDKQRDCGFDAHLCIPTLPGERPICKCGPKFSLKTDEKTGKRYCQSMACVLPTLNDCQQVCVPDNSNMSKPYTCACQPGFQLDPQDGRSCKPERPPASTSSRGPHCRPACPSESQICTDLGCRCKQGFVGEGEVKVRRSPKGAKLTGNSNSNGTATNTIEYTESIRCLNICSLGYAENKEEFEMIESVCPLGLCDPATFQCKCSDPSSASLANEKYEPVYANCSLPNGQQDDHSSGEADDAAEAETQLVRVSPLCHLKRVCEPNSSSYKVCRSQGAICVPDYTKAAKFDCICPPSTEKRFYGQATSGEFTCESKCSSKKSDCLRKQAVCKQIDRDQVRCDCLPGFMLQDNNICYLAKYSYSLNLMVANKYYEPEAHFHRQITFNSSSLMTPTSADQSALCPRSKNQKSSSQEQPVPAVTSSPDEHDEQLNEIVPQFNKLEGRSATPSLAAAAKQMTRSVFIADYNQCNISQVIPKSVIEDPYEHDIESYLGYIEQCNEKIHQNMRNYHLNSRLSEDIRQSLRQHLRDFTVTTNNGSCHEVDATSGMLLNCTVYLQSNEPIDESTVDFVFNDCDKNGHDAKYCWIKPRLLLLKQHLQQSDSSNQTDATKQRAGRSGSSQFQFRQIVPCELGNFCGLDAVSVRLDDRSSLCSCKCPADIEVIDVKDLEPRRQDSDSELAGSSPKSAAVKEICAPRNHCGTNSTHCLQKPGSVCQYDIRTGSRCICVYPAYEDSAGKCVEVAYSQLNSTLILIIIMLGTALLVSVFLNILVAARTKSMFGRSKQYPLNEFSSPSSRPMNRSTGVPNPVFEND